MVAFGYTLLCEQASPKQLVADAAAAENAGFDFIAVSDHYTPWLHSQGHAPFAWSVLGAVAQVTSRLELMSFVTAPVMRYHPVVVAQQAATMGLLSDDRFTLGVGSGENLNEHVLGRGWPPLSARHSMLAEALEIIGGLFDGGEFDYAGEHFSACSARLWDLSQVRVPVATAVSGTQSCRRFSPLADHLIAARPDADLIRQWDAVRSDREGGRRYGQQVVSYDPDPNAAATRARDQFRWSTAGWAMNAELPTPQGFAEATRFVRADDMALAMPCGPDVAQHVAAVRRWVQAGFTDITLVQVGAREQEAFLEFAQRDLLPALRSEFGRGSVPAFG